MLAEGAVQRSLGDDLIKVILIQGYILPAQRRIFLFYPKGIIEGKRVADLQKTVQCEAAVLRKKLLNVFSMLGSAPPFQETQKRSVSDGPQGRKPGRFLG